MAVMSYPAGSFRCESCSAYKPTQEASVWSRIIEAEFDNGVLRPMQRLALRPGERVGIVVVRRSDPARWDVVRLSNPVSGEEELTDSGLGEWGAALDREDQN